MGKLEQLNRAVDYLENHLADELDIDGAAREANCSVWQFTRMFAYLAGMGVGDYVRARRLSLAAEEVAGTSASITDIAVRWGFGSHGAFDRAFKRAYGTTPTQVRAGRKKLKAFHRISFAITVTGGENMEYEIRNCGPMRIAGLPLVEGVPLQDGLVRKDGTLEIAKAWESAFAQEKTDEVARYIDGSEPAGLLQVSLERGGRLDVLLGASTQAAVPQGWRVVDIAAATWAIFKGVGAGEVALQEAIPRLYHKVFAEWLPSSSWKLADLPQFEVYPEDWEKNGFEIWVPVEK